MLAEELDTPISVTIAGQTVRMGILDLSDLAAIEQEIREERQAEAVAELPNSHTAAQLIEAQRSVGRLTFEGLAGEVFTVSGAPKFLRRALLKGGTVADATAADQIISRLARARGWRETAYLAADASGIFPAREAAPDPNPQAGTAAPAT